MSKGKDVKKPKKMKTGGQTGAAPESCASNNGNGNNMQNNNMQNNNMQNNTKG